MNTFATPDQNDLRPRLRAFFVPRGRSADGVCTAGTVVVSRLTMGEMEEVDVDHIAAEKPSHKVRLWWWWWWRSGEVVGEAAGGRACALQMPPR